MEKLATIKAPDQAIEITTEHMKSAYETFVNRPGFAGGSNS